MPLPLFSPNQRVTQESGREDKVEIDIGTWAITTTFAGFENIRSLIAGPPALIRSVVEDDWHNFGYMFNRPSNPGPKRNPLIVRTNTLLGFNNCILWPPLLFAGKWSLAYTMWPGNEPRSKETILQLLLNPTRFIRHQPIPRPLPPSNTPDWPSATLTTSYTELETHGEFSLDGKDNWIPNDELFDAWANPERWRRHLNNYIRGVAVAFHQEVERVVFSYGEFVFSEWAKLRKVETYWEFATPEPIELVKSLIPHLSSYRAGNTSIRTFEATVEETVVNSISFHMRLNAKTALRLYAKTNRRVRFEIIQEDINHRELLDLPLRRRGERAVAPQTSFNDILRVLAGLRARAADELNGVLEFLQQRITVVPSQRSAFSFLMSVAAALHDNEIAHTVVSLLIRHGRIVPRQAGTQIRDACIQLTDAGITAYDSSSCVYDVTQEYRHALSILRGYPLGDLVINITARDRGRTIAITARDRSRSIAITARDRQRNSSTPISQAPVAPEGDSGTIP